MRSPRAAEWSDVYYAGLPVVETRDGTVTDAARGTDTARDRLSCVTICKGSEGRDRALFLHASRYTQSEREI